MNFESKLEELINLSQSISSSLVNKGYESEDEVEDDFLGSPEHNIDDIVFNDEKGVFFFDDNSKSCSNDINQSSTWTSEIEIRNENILSKSITDDRYSNGKIDSTVENPNILRSPDELKTYVDLHSEKEFYLTINYEGNVISPKKRSTDEISKDFGFSKRLKFEDDEDAEFIKKTDGSN